MPLGVVVYPQDPLGYLTNCKDFIFRDLCYQEEVDQETKNNIDKLRKEQSYVENDKLIIKRRATEEEEDRQRRDYHQCPLIPSLDEELIPTTIDRENPRSLQHRKKRRRTSNNKNKEEIENQRMAHITVERNRRKQMNEYLAVLRSLMPSSYTQRGDQASIVGGAITYVKELEHILQSMEPKKATTHEADCSTNSYSTTKLPVTESSSLPAEIKVTVVESHANIKIMAKKKPRQLLKLVASIQSLRLILLHLNLTTHDDSILYSISAKVEEGSQVNTMDKISTALNQIL